MKEKGWTSPHLAEMDSKTKRSYVFVGAAVVALAVVGAAAARTRRRRKT